MLDEKKVVQSKRDLSCVPNRGLDFLIDDDILLNSIAFCYIIIDNSLTEKCASPMKPLNGPAYTAVWLGHTPLPTVTLAGAVNLK